jgi:hypothetical protein
MLFSRMVGQPLRQQPAAGRPSEPPHAGARTANFFRVCGRAHMRWSTDLTTTLKTPAGHFEMSRLSRFCPAFCPAPSGTDGTHPYKGCPVCPGTSSVPLVAVMGVASIALSRFGSRGRPCARAACSACSRVSHMMPRQRSSLVAMAHALQKWQGSRQFHHFVLFAHRPPSNRRRTNVRNDSLR